MPAIKKKRRNIAKRLLDTAEVEKLVHHEVQEKMCVLLPSSHSQIKLTPSCVEFFSSCHVLHPLLLQRFDGT